MAESTKKGRDFEGATPERLARALLRPHRRDARDRKEPQPPKR